MHLWAVMSPAARVNSDEALTGLQAYNVLQGHFAPVVAGNDYGGALESYLTAPLLLVTSGTVALKTVPIVLSFVAGLVLAWAAAPLLGRRVALVVGAVSWVSSGAAVVLWSISYMGYASGAIALVGAIGCAVRLMTRPDPGLAFGAGLGVGVALWGHPIFGVVAALACLPVLGGDLAAPLVDPRPPSAGGSSAHSPGCSTSTATAHPASPSRTAPRRTSERVRIILAELLPSGFGLRSPNGAWLEPFAVTGVVAAVLIVGALVGLVVLTFRVGRAALPFTVAGLGAVPALAAFQALSFSADGRYAVAFMPTLLVGLFGWTRLGRGWERPPHRPRGRGSGGLGPAGLRAIALPVRRLDVGGPQRRRRAGGRRAPAAGHHRGSGRVLDRLRPRLLRQGTARLVAGRRATAARRRRLGPQATSASHVAQVYDARRRRERLRHPPAAQGGLHAPPGRPLGDLGPRRPEPTLPPVGSVQTWRVGRAPWRTRPTRSESWYRPHSPARRTPRTGAHFGPE